MNTDDLPAEIYLCQRRGKMGMPCGERTYRRDDRTWYCYTRGATEPGGRTWGGDGQVHYWA